MSWGQTLFLKRIIQGEKIFASSDANITSLSESSWFKPKLNGIVRFKFDVYSPYDLSGYGVIRIIDEENKVIAASKEYTVSKDESTWIYGAFIDFSVTKGKKYSVEILNGGGGGSIYISNGFICAQVVDANYFEKEKKV